MKACETWKSVDEIPSDVKARFNQSLVCRDSGKLDEACRILTSLIDEYPQWSPPYSIKGGILFGLRLFEEAEKCFRQAVCLKPKSETASLGLFHSLWQQSQHDAAMEEMKRFTTEGCVSQDYKDILQEIHAKTTGVESSNLLRKCSSQSDQ